MLESSIKIITPMYVTMQLYNSMHPPDIPLNNIEPPKKAGENINTLITIFFFRQTNFYQQRQTLQHI